MGRKHKTLPEWFTEEYVNNHTAVQIAERYGSSPNNVFGICNERKWRPLPARTLGYTGILDAMKDRITTMTATQVSREYRIPIKTVWAWCHSRNIKLIKQRKKSKPKKQQLVKKEKQDFSLNNKVSYGSVGNWYCNVYPKNYY